MGARASRLLPALESTTRGLAVSAWRLDKEKITEGIYALPEDLTNKGERRHARLRRQRGPGSVIPFRKGDRKWVRTGHLRRSERVEITGPASFQLANSASYAEPRHEAGKPGRRKINPARESHWQEETAAIMRPIVQEQWHETVLDVLRSP